MGDTPELLLATLLLLGVGAEMVITVHVGAGSNVILGHRPQGENIKQKKSHQLEHVILSFGGLVLRWRHPL